MSFIENTGYLQCPPILFYHNSSADFLHAHPLMFPPTQFTHNFNGKSNRKTSFRKPHEDSDISFVKCSPWHIIFEIDYCRLFSSPRGEKEVLFLFPYSLFASATPHRFRPGPPPTLQQLLMRSRAKTEPIGEMHGECWILSSIKLPALVRGRFLLI